MLASFTYSIVESLLQRACPTILSCILFASTHGTGI